jgi:GT2 family glycosyltransferase
VIILINITASIVVYRSEIFKLDFVIRSLFSAVNFARSNIDFTIKIVLIINDETFFSYKKIIDKYPEIEIICGHGNIGYGAAHNLALLKSSGDFIFIINPDVEIDKNFIVNMYRVFISDEGFCLLSPEVVDSKGDVQYLCKKYPSILLLFIRGFLPPFLQKYFTGYIRFYEFSHYVDRFERFEPVIATGCCMVIRGDLFRKIGGFDSRFFLYFEDYDLTMRIAEHAKVIYEPSIKIVHHGGGASRKGWWHIKLFITSAFRFFNKHGWRWY